LRTEGMFNDPGDFDVNKGLSNFGYLQQLGGRINRRLLDVERVSQNCGLSADSLTRVVRPTATEDGCRAPGLGRLHSRLNRRPAPEPRPSSRPR
jgi:hypothetical protein